MSPYSPFPAPQEPCHDALNLVGMMSVVEPANIITKRWGDLNATPLPRTFTCSIM